MSKFATKIRKTDGTDAVNYEGAPAYRQSAELELVSILFTSFLKDQFYRTEADIRKRIDELLQAVDPQFAAKAAILGRTEFAMRSVSHYVAAQLAKSNHGTAWMRKFIGKVIHRADDALEILACYMVLNGNEAPLPNAMRRGIADALTRFNGYQLAKYAKSGSALKMVDLVNLVHPRKTEAIDQLMKGTLAPADTWEVGISEAGPDMEAKSEKWGELVREKKLGYMALVRNLRNIMEADQNLLPLLCEQLINPDAIRKSLMLPFRFSKAIEVVETEIHRFSPWGAIELGKALSQAVDISLANVPRMAGRNCVVLDTSASMGQPKTSGSPANIGCLFAACLIKALAADLILFSSDAEYHAYRPMDSTLTLARSIPFAGGGTNLNAAFNTMRRGYDRIVILSDMQNWVAGHVPRREFDSFKGRYNCNPWIYHFDLQGYGTMQFPEDKVICLTGFNDKIFQIMEFTERDPQALLNQIKAVVL
jgi:60 kDa SS-A/Ro ribonucleoprotein